MKFTGHQDFVLHEGRNFCLERVATLPSFLPEYEGRVVFITTPGPDYGLHYGGTTAWIAPLTSYLAQQLIQPVDFIYYDFPNTSAVGIDLSEDSGITDQQMMPISGSLIMMAVTMDPPLSLGAVVAHPTIAGVEIPINALDVTVTAPAAFDKKISIAGLPQLDVPYGSPIGVRIYGAPGNLPVESNIKITLYEKMVVIP
jgi:hypothetical protein